MKCNCEIGEFDSGMAGEFQRNFVDHSSKDGDCAFEYALKREHGTQYIDDMHRNID